VDIIVRVKHGGGSDHFVVRRVEWLLNAATAALELVLQIQAEQTCNTALLITVGFKDQRIKIETASSICTTGCLQREWVC
jgi:hypothetical protein